MDRATRNGFIALIAAGLVLPFLLYSVLAMKILCFALFACAFNLLLGFTGLLSFGHAAFLASAGYAAGHAIKVWGFPFEFGLLFGTLVSTLLGAIVGWFAIRRQGIYFAMITLALAQMVYFVFLQADFTGGEDGLQGIPRGKFLGIVDLRNDLAMYYVTFIVFLIGFLAIYRVIHSPFGQVLKAIRENEPRALSLGYDVDRYKLLAFVISAGLAGLAGALKAVVLGFETLSDAHWSMSGEVVLMTLIGGMGSVFGPSVGAAVIVALQNLLADRVGSWVQVIMGGIFILCVLAFRRGIVGELAALLDKRKGAAKS